MRVCVGVGVCGVRDACGVFYLSLNSYNCYYCNFLYSVSEIWMMIILMVDVIH